MLVLALVVAVLAVIAVGITLRGDDEPEVPPPGREAGGGPRLSWAPPRLRDDERITVTSEDPVVNLDAGRDYVIDLGDAPIRSPEGLTIRGGRNVVLVGGEVEVPRAEGGDDGTGRGMMLVGQSGTVHVEGVRLTGDGLVEGIDLDQRRGAIVQLQNIRIDRVHYPESLDNHPDLVQTWAGPAELRVDRLAGVTEYQGFFLAPGQFGKTPPRRFDLRNVAIEGATDRAAYALWQSSDFPVSTREVRVHDPRGKSRDQLLWPKRTGWPDVEVTDEPPPDPIRADPGTAYRSPGYRGDGA